MGKGYSPGGNVSRIDRKSTRLNSSHGYISYAVFCLKKKKKKKAQEAIINNTKTNSQSGMSVKHGNPVAGIGVSVTQISCVHYYDVVAADAHRSYAH